jgi:hypothetical protein
MTVVGMKCTKCGDVIYSRAHHDFHWCNCKSIAIDGGREYTKMTGVDFVQVELDVDASNEELITDYYREIDKYGHWDGASPGVAVL